jgi:hypothetical protein
MMKPRLKWKRDERMIYTENQPVSYTRKIKVVAGGNPQPLHHSLAVVGSR